MIQFKIGMAYATLAKNTSAIICNRSKSFVTVKTVRPGSPDKIFRKKIFVFTSSITDDYEYIKNDGLRDVWCNAVEFADEQPATAEITPASDNDNATASQPANVANAESETSTQPEPLYDDDSFSDAPGDNSYPEQDIPNDYNPLHIVQTWYGGNHSDAEICRLNRNYEAPHYKGYSIFAQFIPSVPVRFCLAKSESQAVGLAREYCNAFCVPCKCTDARVEKLCDFFPDWTDFLPYYMDDSLSIRVFRDFHYDPLHFFRDRGLHERKNDNPGLTVIPSENISRPHYRAVHDTPQDDIPCVNVPACDIPATVAPERNTSTAEGFGIVLLKHRQLGFTFNTDCNPRQIWFDFEF